MRTFSFEKLERKSFVSKKHNMRVEFRQNFGIIFVKVTDIITGIELSDEMASNNDIKFLLAKNGL